MAAEKRTVTVSLIRESGALFYGECASVTVPSQKDMITVLPYHTPLIMKLGAGPIIVRTDGQKQTLTDVKTGIIYVGDNEVVILADL